MTRHPLSTGSSITVYDGSVDNQGNLASFLVNDIVNASGQSHVYVQNGNDIIVGNGGQDIKDTAERR